MPFLKEKEWIFLNEITHLIHDIENLDEMRTNLLELLGILIPNDASSFYLAKNDGVKLLYKPVAINMPQEDIKNYLEYGEKVDYTIPIFKNARPIAYKETDLFNNREKTVYYNDFLSHGFEFPAALCIANNGICYGAVSLFRSKRSGDFCEKEVFILNQLQKHLVTRLFIENSKDKKNRGDMEKSFDLEYKYHLTSREIEIIYLVIEGLNNKEISTKLFIGEGTVKKHLHSVYRKLSVNNRVQLMKLLL